MAQSLRNSLKRQSLCWRSENWLDRLLPWALAGEDEDTGLGLGLELEVPAFAAERPASVTQTVTRSSAPTEQTHMLSLQSVNVLLLFTGEA